jgi:hypothetical protein
MSGTNIKTLPAWMEPKVVLCGTRQKQDAHSEPTNTHHEADKERSGSILSRTDELRTVPEHESNNEEDHRLGQRIERIAVECSLVGATERTLERSAIGIAAVTFTSERSDSLDGTGSLASDLSRILMGGLVRLVFQDNDTLKGNVRK